MSLDPTTAAGLPVVNQALEPAWVRHGSTSVQKDYTTALGFERVMLEQLTKSLSSTSGLGGESSEEGGAEGAEGTDAGASQLSSMFPQALSSGVLGAGGLGLAAQLTREMQGVHAVGQAHSGAAIEASGGTPA